MAPPANISSNPADLSLAEMMRVMDVATTLRRERTTAFRELDRDQTKAQLRQRLLAAAEVTGEAVTEREVDAAIDLYFQNLHTYRPPGRSVSVVLAHLYVMRRRIVGYGLLAVVLAALLLWFVVSARGCFSSEIRNERRVERISAEVIAHHGAIRAIVREPETSAEADQWKQEAQAAQARGDTDAMATPLKRLGDLRSRLEQAYRVQVVGGPGRSGTERLITDEAGERISGYYLIVEARQADGTVFKRRIRNAETGREQLVASWGERVPKDVFERLLRDKQEDGLLDERAFSVKRRGYREETIQIKDDDGQPIERRGQITQW
ncbi:MAG: DUF6384 family protein [Phycisphaerae bacterium]|nr:DUF6384 family protein [Phycisphaerae bacterium]